MLQEIQKFDYDRYLSVIFAPKDKRDDIMAVILFNFEIARIRAKVTEAMMGHIRLQWWRDAIEEIFNETKTPRRHNVVIQLKQLVTKYKLDKDDFLNVINAREKDLDDEPFKTEQDFNDYAFNTAYPISKLILGVLDIVDERIFAAEEKISKAWAVAAILRSANRNFSDGRVVFPADVMERYGLSSNDFGSPEFIERSKPLVKELYDKAEIELSESEKILADVSKMERKRALPALLNLRTTKHHIKQIKGKDYDVFTKIMNPYLGFWGLTSLYIKQK